MLWGRVGFVGLFADHPPAASGRRGWFRAQSFKILSSAMRLDRSAIGTLLVPVARSLDAGPNPLRWQTMKNDLPPLEAPLPTTSGDGQPDTYPRRRGITTAQGRLHRCDPPVVHRR